MGDWDWELIETKKWTKSQIKSDTKLRSEDVILELEEKTAKQRIKEEFVFCGDALVDEEEFETLQNLNKIVMTGIYQKSEGASSLERDVANELDVEIGRLEEKTSKSLEEKMKLRKLKMRRNQRNKRKRDFEKETETERDERLRFERERKHKSRCAETNESKRSRLEQMRVHKRKVRENERKEEKSQRLEKMRTQKNNVHQNEIELERGQSTPKNKNSERNKAKETLLENMETYKDVFETICENETNKALNENKTFKKKHQNINKKDNEPFDCIGCGETISGNLKLRLHMEEEHKDSEKNFVCPKSHCEGKFSSKQGFEVHMNRHNGKVIICPDCGKSFFSEVNLKAHIKEKTKKTFNCEQCPQICSSQEGLERHVQMHDIEREFPCNECNLRFEEAYVLKRHMKLSHEILSNTLQCPLCEKSFKIKHSLHQHTKIVHNKERNHECSDCGYKFFSRTKLNRHVGRKHQN